MATPPLTLWIDSINNRLVSGWRGLTSAHKPVFKRGDTVDVLIRWVKPPMVAQGQMEEVIFPAGDEVQMVLGRRGERPTAGRWYLTYGGESSDLIDWNASASVLQSVMNRMATISAAGGVSISQSQNDIYKITFNLKGERTTLTVNGMSLLPTGDGLIDVLSAGSPTDYAVWTLALRQTPIAECNTFTQESACEAEFELIRDDIQDLFLTSDPKDGYFKFTLNGLPEITVSVFEDAETLKGKLPTGYSVLKAGDFRWRIQKNDGTQFVLSVTDSSEIVSFSGKVGEITLDTQEAYEFLSGRAYSEAILEVIRTHESGVAMIYQGQATILNKIEQ